MTNLLNSRLVIISFITLLLFVFGGSGIYGQASQNTVTVQIDPNDWHQVIYRRSITKKDSILFHSWYRQETEAKLIRVNWVRNQKLTQSVSISFGGGPQVLITKVDTDPQLFASVEPVYKKDRLTIRNMTGFNISFRKPLVIKNVTKVTLSLNKKFQAGYQSELLFNTKTGLRENYQGATINFVATKKVSFGLYGYKNLSRPNDGLNVRFTAVVNF